MPDPAPNSTPTPEPTAPTQTGPIFAPAAPEPPIDFRIGDEFGTAKRNLPPAKIVGLCVLILLIVVAIAAFLQRPKPQGAGAINLVTAVEISGQSSVLTAVTLTLHNSAGRPLWIRSLKAKIETADGHTYEDEAASAVDIDRYYQLFPSLKESSEAPLSPETKLQPGDEKRGTLVFSFPVTKDIFDQRKSLAVVIQPYDQPLPITLK